MAQMLQFCYKEYYSSIGGGAIQKIRQPVGCTSLKKNFETRLPLVRTGGWYLAMQANGLKIDFQIISNWNLEDLIIISTGHENFGEYLHHFRIQDSPSCIYCGYNDTLFKMETGRVKHEELWKMVEVVSDVPELMEKMVKSKEN